MLRNYIKSAFRVITRNKLFSLINILGLAIGMSACLLILHYVNYERSYDRFHPDDDRIYRLRYERANEDGSQAVRFASCCPPAAPRIRERYPEVEKIGRIFKSRGAVVTTGDLKFLENRIFYAETEFFEVLEFKFIEGDPVIDLAEPGRAFISQSTARKYFGDEDPIGKRISVDKRTDYQIVGLFEDVPPRSHLKFDFLLSFENLATYYGPDVMEAWGHTGFYTYLKLRPDTDLPAFKTKLAELVETEFGEALRYYQLTCDLVLQPLTDIHLDSHFMQEYEINGDRDAVNFLAAIALFIIIMAWVNYVNLSTARSLTRAREVGLRKSIGASRKQLMVQFFLETIIFNLLAVAITLGLVEVSLPYFSHLTGVSETIPILSQGWFWLSLLGLFLLGIVLSGLYPVTVLSAFMPAVVLRKKLGHEYRGITLRKALVAFQFVLALCLMTATFAVFRQVRYMKQQDLGFSINQTLVVQGPHVRDDTFNGKVDTFKEILSTKPDIAEACMVTEVPGRQIMWDNGGIFRAGGDASGSRNYQIVGADYDFINVFDLEMIEGRNFSRDFSTDSTALILNETAVRWMGFEEDEKVIGQKVDYWDQIFTIIGVIKDYHQQSLKQDIEPTLIRLAPYGRGPWGMFSLKLTTDNVRETVHMIEKQYEASFPGNPFKYFFLDDYYNQQYKADELLGKVLGIFSSLAILVTCLGLFGMSSFMALQRTKEIGIRKVLGASISWLVIHLLREYFVVILLSFIIAWPILYFGIDWWLTSYAMRMSLTVTLFILPLVLVSLVSAFTISSHVVRTATSNPVDALRYE